MQEQYILAIDQGTSGTKTVIFNARGEIVAKAVAGVNSSFPQPGFVEQAPAELSERAGVGQSLRAKVSGRRVREFSEHHNVRHFQSTRNLSALGSGRHAALQRAGLAMQTLGGDGDRLQAAGIEPDITARTGLIIDPYFSGTKLIWLYEHDPQLQAKIDAGQAYFGTVDTWLLWQLTHGQRYYTDYTNACGRCSLISMSYNGIARFCTRFI